MFGAWFACVAILWNVLSLVSNSTITIRLLALDFYQVIFASLSPSIATPEKSRARNVNVNYGRQCEKVEEFNLMQMRGLHAYLISVLRSDAQVQELFTLSNP